MVKSTRRTKTISTKLSAEEYERLAAVAGGQSMSEWAREALLRAAGSGAIRAGRQRP